jgi:hypothetical protein
VNLNFGYSNASALAICTDCFYGVLVNSRIETLSMPWGGIHPATAGELDRHGAISPYKDHQCSVSSLGSSVVKLLKRRAAKSAISRGWSGAVFEAERLRLVFYVDTFTSKQPLLKLAPVRHAHFFCGHWSSTFLSTAREQRPGKPPLLPAAMPGSWSSRPAHQDATRTQNSMFGI